MNSLEWWLVPIFGWPGPIFAVVLSIIGIIALDRIWLFGAAVVLCPFSLYLGGSPRMRYLIFLPLLPLFGGWAVSRGRVGLAWISILTLSAIVTWVALIWMDVLQ
jgi:hypothetical protein